MRRATSTRPRSAGGTPRSPTGTRPRITRVEATSKAGSATITFGQSITPVTRPFVIRLFWGWKSPWQMTRRGSSIGRRPDNQTIAFSRPRRALERRSSGRRRSGCHSRRSSALAARRSPTLARGAPRGDARAAAGPARSSGVSLESPQPFLGHGGDEMDWPHGTRGRTKRLLLRMRSSIAVLWSTSRIYSAEQMLQKYGPNPAAIIAVATQWAGATTKSLILHSWTDLAFKSPTRRVAPHVP